MGIPEDDHEKDNPNLLMNKLQEILEKYLKVTECDIDKCFRMGAPGVQHKVPTGRSRPVFASFIQQYDRDLVWANRKSLKGYPIIIKEDLPIEIESRARVMLPILKEAKKHNRKATLVRDALYINGQKYTESTLYRLPNSLQPITLSSKKVDDKYFFWGKDNPLSNFHKCEFSEKDVT